MSYQAPPVRYGPQIQTPASLPPMPAGLPARPPVTVPPVEYKSYQNRSSSTISSRPTINHASVVKSVVGPAPNLSSDLILPDSTRPLPLNSMTSLQTGAPIPIPTIEDALKAFETTISSLAHLCYSGQNIAVATGYKACPVQERDSEKKVILEMTEPERDVYLAWKSGTMEPLPEVDWVNDRIAAPTGDTSNSAKSLKVAKKRAEALNRLYKTNLADASHAVYWAQKHPEHLSLVKAVARIVGAEVAATGGNENLNSEEWAELQTLGKVISVGSQYMQKQPKNNPAKKFINGNLQVLIARRQQLQSKVSGTNAAKRKAESDPSGKQPEKKGR